MAPKKSISGSRLTNLIFQQICDSIATSDKGLDALCTQHKVSSRQFYRHIESSAEKRQAYERARDEQAEYLADQIIAIADDTSGDTIQIADKNGVLRDAEDKEWTSRSKLRIDARKWTAAHLKPKKYGDRLELEGNLEKNIVVSFKKRKGGAD